MNVRLLMSIFTLIVRLLRQLNELRAPAGEKGKSKGKPAPAPARRPAAPPAPPAANKAGRRALAQRRSNRWLGSTLRMLFGAGVAGSAAYLVVRQRQRYQKRWEPIHAPFPEELLGVLAPPGGAGRFFFTGEGLIDVDTDGFYPVVDGIPDFGGLDRASFRVSPLLRWYQDGGWLMETYDLFMHQFFVPVFSGGNVAGIAALAGSVAAEAYDGWCLSAPCGTGTFEIEMARANPQAKFVCLDSSWGMLLEARRKALDAGLANLYFVRGDAQLLPLQTAVFDGVWSSSGFELYPRLEQAMTQLTRVAKRGAIVAGDSPVLGGPLLSDLAVRALAPWMPGLRDAPTQLSLLAAAGLRDLTAVRDGANVRFRGVRAA